MVDVSDKAATERVAVAEGRVVMTRDDARSRAQGQRQEGRRARRRAHRRHHGGQAHARADPALPSARALQGRGRHRAGPASCPASSCARPCKVNGQTGVEMEALTAVSVACLTIYDMVKAVERGMRIEGIRLIEKRGGKSGHYRAKGAEHGADVGRRSACAACSTAPTPLPAEAVPLAEAARPRARRGSRRAAHPAAGRCLGDGRLRGARRRRCDRAGDAEADRRGRGRPPVRRHGRRRRGRAHLHRRRAAGRRRHRRDPGEHRRATATPSSSSSRRRAGQQRPRRRASISARATCCCRRAAASPAATSRSPPR